MLFYDMLSLCRPGVSSPVSLYETTQVGDGEGYERLHILFFLILSSPPACKPTIKTLQMYLINCSNAHLRSVTRSVMNLVNAPKNKKGKQLISRLQLYSSICFKKSTEKVRLRWKQAKREGFGFI